MSSVTAASVFQDARGYLNDVSAVTYTDAILLTWLRTAYEHLRNIMAANGFDQLRIISTSQTVLAGATTLTDPSNMLVPLNLEERANGTTDNYTPMTERTWETNIPASASLRYWAYHDTGITFPAASTDREVVIYYLKDLSPQSITVGTTSLVGNARAYLGARTAALVAAFVMRNEGLAMAANSVADEQLRYIVSFAVTNMQARPTRRRPFLGPRNR